MGCNAETHCWESIVEGGEDRRRRERGRMAESRREEKKETSIEKYDFILIKLIPLYVQIKGFIKYNILNQKIYYEAY